MRKAVFYFILLLVVCMPVGLYADELILMSGKTVEGRVVEQKDDYVIIEVNGVNMIYRRFEVKDVVMGDSRRKRFEAKDAAIRGDSRPRATRGYLDEPINPERPVFQQPQRSGGSPDKNYYPPATASDLSSAQLGEDLLKRIDDPSTKEALIKFEAAMLEIGKDCPPPKEGADLLEVMNNASKCACKHLSEVVKVNQIKVDAFVDLMKRRPELINETVHIEGTLGNWVLRPEDVNKNSIAELSKIYNCK